MRITVFTSNQPRHCSLVRSLAECADQVYVVCEATTLFPGTTTDLYRQSPVMSGYFEKVRDAEAKVFGKVAFAPPNARVLAMKVGDLSNLPLTAFAPALESDIFVVFGASYIKGPLCEFLVSKKALNIHLGTSPYYRGSSCNFWAIYDGRPEYVGATIHLLSKGLDSGAMLFHALPAPQRVDGFTLGMKAVKVAHDALRHHIQSGKIWDHEPVIQNREFELRYSKMSEFTDEVAQSYLASLRSPEEIEQSLTLRELDKFLRPFVA